MSLLDEPSLRPNNENKVVEIEFIKTSAQQTVAYTEATNLDFTNQVPSNFRSKESQRVEDQQIARNNGKTQNRSRKKILPKKKVAGVNAKKQIDSEISTASSKEKDRDAVVDQQAEENIYDQLYKAQGISTIQDRIFQDIKYGNFTALNTNKYQFYSFYERVNEQVRIRWIENIEGHLNQLKMQNAQILRSKKEWITQLVVVLDKNGNITNSYLDKNSGLVIWDESAKQAFLDSGPFKNPPKEMADSEGNIRLSYLFSLKLN